MTDDQPFSLKGKKCLITGASSGIGRQVSIELSKAGADCIISGRRKEGLEQTAAEMNRPTIQLLADILLEDDRKKLVEEAGKVDVLVHCAGASAIAPIRYAKEESIRSQADLNYVAPTALLQALLWKNAINKGGSIILISSMAAFVGIVGNGIYSGPKAALIAMARCLALEVAKNNIRVNCICPSYVDTPLLDAAGIRDAMEERKSLHPLGIGTVNDVAATVRFFASEESRWITGQTIIMDGGYTLR